MKNKLKILASSIIVLMLSFTISCKDKKVVEPSASQQEKVVSLASRLNYLQQYPAAADKFLEASK